MPILPILRAAAVSIDTRVRIHNSSIPPYRDLVLQQYLPYRGRATTCCNVAFVSVLPIQQYATPVLLLYRVLITIRTNISFTSTADNICKLDNRHRNQYRVVRVASSVPGTSYRTYHTIQYSLLMLSVFVHTVRVIDLRFFKMDNR